MAVDQSLVYRLLGRRLKKRRTELGITQDDLGSAIGVLRTSITNIEAGRQRPPLHVIYKICTELGTEVRDVLPSSGEVNVQQTVRIHLGGVSKQVPKSAEGAIHELFRQLRKRSKRS